MAGGGDGGEGGRGGWGVRERDKKRANWGGGKDSDGAMCRDKQSAATQPPVKLVHEQYISRHVKLTAAQQ